MDRGDNDVVRTPEDSAGADLSHVAFLAILIAKGLLGLAQLAIAVLIHFGAVQQLPAIAKWFFREELTQDPTDFIATHILKIIVGADTSHLTFYQAYFAVHGLLHVGIVAALLAGALWAYPLTIAVLILFIVYQAIEWLNIGGPMLLVLTAIDVIVIWLTYIEWQKRRG